MSGELISAVVFATIEVLVAVSAGIVALIRAYVKKKKRDFEKEEKNEKESGKK